MYRVIETRRGRCGEYSRLFFKAAEALHYKARWVVDWEVRTCLLLCSCVGMWVVCVIVQ